MWAAPQSVESNACYCLVGMFAVTHYFVVEADHKLDTLQLIGNLRMHTVESAIAVRSAALMHDAGVDYSAFGNTTYVTHKRP